MYWKKLFKVVKEREGLETAKMGVAVAIAFRSEPQKVRCRTWHGWIWPIAWWPRVPLPQTFPSSETSPSNQIRPPRWQWRGQTKGQSCHFRTYKILVGPGLGKIGAGDVITYGRHHINFIYHHQRLALMDAEGWGPALHDADTSTWC